MVARVHVALLAVVCISREATSHVPTLRREQPVSDHRMQLNSAGEILDVRKEKGLEQHQQNSQQKVMRGKTKGQPSYCDFDFPLGKSVSNECNNATTDRLLETEGECAEAASEAGLDFPGDITDDEKYKWIRPFGCFLADCDPNADVKKPCYFWNGVAESDLNVSDITLGRPVCKRDKIVLGTPNTNPIEGCPTGYKAIDDHETCHLDGPCIGDWDADQFRANNFNASKYDLYPLYCFLGKMEPGQVDDEVYYNAPLLNTDPETHPPASVASGTPICNVSTITFFPNKSYPAMFGLADDGQ